MHAKVIYHQLDSYYYSNRDRRFVMDAAMEVEGACMHGAGESDNRFSWMDLSCLPA